jgi:hypothetical protein
MSKQQAKKPMPQPRNPVVLIARSRTSAGPMRDRRARRAKSARKSWQRDQEAGDHE